MKVEDKKFVTLSYTLTVEGQVADAATAELKVGTYKYFLDIEQNNLDPDSLLK